MCLYGPAMQLLSESWQRASSTTAGCFKADGRLFANAGVCGPSSLYQTMSHDCISFELKAMSE